MGHGAEVQIDLPLHSDVVKDPEERLSDDDYMFKHSATLRNKQRCLASQHGLFVGGQDCGCNPLRVMWAMYLGIFKPGKETEEESRAMTLYQTLYHLLSASDFIICDPPDVPRENHPRLLQRSNDIQQHADV